MFPINLLVPNISSGDFVQNFSIHFLYVISLELPLHPFQQFSVVTDISFKVTELVH